ncbi:MAG: hypothetical protein JWQ04_2615 [Pedosphaera sp.]|nr:hypothetical protein [Pedosphaera sp.]
MSKTRTAPAGAPISQERYLSSPEYAELRGISGNAVTTKAALLAHPDKRSLLFFLQAMSIKPGGLKTLCRDFLQMFSSRIGTATMHSAGMKPGKIYDVKTTATIEAELDETGCGHWLREREKPAARKTVEEFLADCRQKLARLEGFIIELCINPKLYFAAPGETEDAASLEKIIVEERFVEEPAADWRASLPTFAESSLPYFQDIIGALFEYQRRYNEATRRDFVETEVSRKVFEVLDFALWTGKLVVIEGDSRIGKTTATEAWCNLHLGQARFVSLSGITHKTGLFRALAKVLGIGSSYARSSTEIQTRVEDLLQRSRLMVVIDEAHHLFSSSERVYSRPELVDWINTSLYNQGVPVGLVSTPQFQLRMARAEKQTTWNSDQFRGRNKRFWQLPARASKKDVEAVARKLLPGASRECIDLVVGYAIGSKLPFPALVDAIDEAKFLVHREGRLQVTFEDLDRGIMEYAAPSAAAMNRSYSAQLANKRPGRKPAPAPAIPADDEAELAAERFNIEPATLGARNVAPGHSSHTHNRQAPRSEPVKAAA